MKRVIVRYKVKGDKRDENIAFIKDVFKELEASAPEGLKYASFVLEDHRTFIHIASVETDDGSNPLAQIEAFKAFVKDINDRCEDDDHPLATPAELIGSYRLFD